MEILIIKLGAKGDVVRTLPILLPIKEKFPDSKITWITKPSSREILETSPHINKLLTTPITESQIQELPEFDILYNLDIEGEATNLAMITKANKKLGFYSEAGYASAFNFPAEYYISTSFDDQLKKTNTKTCMEKNI